MIAEETMRSIELDLKRLIAVALYSGLVLEIRLEPKPFLPAMGEYTMVPSVRLDKHHSYRKTT